MFKNVVYVEFPKTAGLSKIKYIKMKDGTKIINLNYDPEA